MNASEYNTEIEQNLDSFIKSNLDQAFDDIFEKNDYSSFSYDMEGNSQSAKETEILYNQHINEARDNGAFISLENLAEDIKNW